MLLQVLLDTTRYTGCTVHCVKQKVPVPFGEPLPPLLQSQACRRASWVWHGYCFCGGWLGPIEGQPCAAADRVPAGHQDWSHLLPLALANAALPHVHLHVAPPSYDVVWITQTQLCAAQHSRSRQTCNIHISLVIIVTPQVQAKLRMA